MPTPICGDEGFVQVGASRLDVTEWTGSEEATWAETTHTGSAGYKESVVCKRVLTGTVTADYDPAFGPKNAPDIDAGDQVAMELHTGATGNYTLTANVINLNWTVPSADKISYNFAFESNGAYAYA